MLKISRKSVKVTFPHFAIRNEDNKKCFELKNNHCLYSKDEYLDQIYVPDFDFHETLFKGLFIIPEKLTHSARYCHTTSQVDQRVTPGCVAS